MISKNTFKSLHQKIFFLLVLLLPTQLGLHFWPDWASVFGIRVDYLSPTIYLTDILVIMLLFSWMLSSKFQISNFKFQIKYLALFIYLLATSLIVAQNSGVAIYKLIKLAEFSLLGWCVYKNYKLYIVNSAFKLVLAAAMLYSCVIAWVQFLTGHTVGGLLWLLGERNFGVSTPGIALVNIGGIDYLRAYATFPHPNVLAGFLLVGILLLFAGPAPGFPLTRVTRSIVACAISTIILSFSHSAWIAGLVALVFLNIDWFRKRTKLFTQYTFFGVLILSLIIPVATSKVDTSALPEEIVRRIDLSKAAMNMAADSPLFGVGIGNFVVRLPEYGSAPAVSWWLQPVHNVFLLVLTETGLIGLGFVIWLLLFVSKKLITNHYSLFTAFLVILITGMTDHYWLTLQQGQLMATIVFAASIATIKR